MDDVGPVRKVVQVLVLGSIVVAYAILLTATKVWRLTRRSTKSKRSPARPKSVQDHRESLARRRR